MNTYEVVIGIREYGGGEANSFYPLPDETLEFNAVTEEEALQKAKEIVQQKKNEEQWDKQYRLKAVHKVIFHE